VKKIAVIALSALAAGALPQALGTWSNINWPNGYYVRGIHLVLLPDSRLMLWNNQYSFGQPAPDTERIVMAQPGANFTYDTFGVGTGSNFTTNLFCAGHTFLEDGRLFLAGGHKLENGYGDDRVNVFDFKNPGNVWVTSENVMTQYRWYPSATHLPDRRVLITTGIGGPTHVPSYFPDLWVVDVPWKKTELQDYNSALPEFQAIDAYYPFLFIDPKDGNVFLANRGKGDEAPNGNKKLNLATLQWSNYGQLSNQNINVRQQYPSAVMVNAKNESGVREAIILMSGGSKTGEQTLASNSALFTNLLDANPTWTAAANMIFGRQCHTLTALATGDVVAFGGTDRFGPNGDPYLAEAQPRTTPELWNPWATDRATRPWRALAQPTNIVPRGYHSTAVLLPDARVMTSGGEPEGAPPGSGFEFQWNSQIYSPPYGGRNDWATRRPTLSAAPTVIRYGETFQVTMAPNATSGRPITKLMLVSSGAVTHAFNGRQEVIELDFQHVSGNTYNVTPPPAPKHATPGYYMLFAVDNTDEGTGTRIKGIPSLSKWVQLKDFEQIFVSNGQLLGGIPLGQILWTKEDSLLLGDNKYLANGIRYGPGFTGPRVETIFTGIAETPNPTKVRLRVQAKCTSTARLTVYFKNVSTGLWVQAGDPLDVTQSDKDFEIVVDNNNFIAGNGELSARVHFRAMSPSFVTPSVSIDLAELGVR
jgi:hypothetical protein